MIGRGNSFLGLAFLAENAIACAEVGVAGGVKSVRRAATFALPAELTSDNAVATGQALANFLRQNKFSASRAVVGVPARWLVALEKELPPADSEAAHAALRLQAERLAVAESGEMIFDFAGETHRSTASKVLLVGMQRQRLQRIEKLLDAAGMTVIAVTSSGLTLSAAIEGEESGVLTINRAGAELVWRQAGNARMLRHVPLALNGNQAPATTLFAGEFRRMIAMAGTNGSTTARSLLLIDSVGLNDEQVDTLSERLGVKVISKSQRDMLGVEPTDGTDSADIAPAIALGLLAAKDKLPLDFAHSRLAPPVQHRFGRIGTLAIGVGALLLIGIVTLFVIVQVRQSELDKLNAQSRAMKDQVTAARAAIDRLNTGRGYFETDKRTPVLEAMRHITESLKPDDKLWVTSFGLKDTPDGYKGTLMGKAADRNTILAVSERLQKNKHITAWNQGEIREVDARSHEHSFSVTFDYIPGE
jgi:hypothetical protein